MRHVDALRYAATQAEMAGSTDRALDFIRVAADEVDPDADPVTAGLVHERWGRYLWILNHSAEELLPHLDEAVRLVPDEPTPERARVLATRGQQLMLADQLVESVEVCEQAIAIAQQIGDQVAEAHARNTLGASLAALGKTEEGLEQLQLSRDLAERTRSWTDVARAAVNVGGALQSVARYEEALEISLAGAALARQRGLDRYFGAFLRLNACEALWLFGRWNEMEEQLREVDATQPVGIDVWRSAEAWSHLYAGVGDFDAARRRDRCPADAVRADRPGEVPRDLRHARSTVRVVERRSRLARWSSRTKASPCLGPRRRSVPTRASAFRCCCAVRPRLRIGPTSLLPVRSPERSTGGSRPTGGSVAARARSTSWPRTSAPRARVRRGTSDPAAWASVAAGWERFGVRTRMAYARWREAEAHVEGGDRERGAVTAAAAGTRLPVTSAGCGSATASRASAAGRAWTSAWATSTPPSAAERLGLTARELEVLALVAEGRTNRQIAQSLFISAKTASVHVSNILAKLGVANRGEAGAAARRLGLDRAELPA